MFFFFSSSDLVRFYSFKTILDTAPNQTEIAVGKIKALITIRSTLFKKI